jgi:hypothetical protein
MFDFNWYIEKNGIPTMGGIQHWSVVNKKTGEKYGEISGLYYTLSPYDSVVDICFRLNGGESIESIYNNPSLHRIQAETLTALWSYDSYPFTLHGKVVEADSDGRVMIEGYGHAWFSPFIVRKTSDVKALTNRLDELKRLYNQAIEDVNKEYKSQLKYLFECKNIVNHPRQRSFE